MEKDEIREIFVEVLNEIQTLNGQSTPIITEDTFLLNDLPGFDSLNSVETSVLLSNRLGCEIKSEILLQSTPEGNLTVKKIVDHIAKILNEE